MNGADRPPEVAASPAARGVSEAAPSHNGSQEAARAPGDQAAGPAGDSKRLGPGAGLKASNRTGQALVFISYAHDDRAHEERVRDFWWFLRAQGIDARLVPRNCCGC